MAKSLAPAKSDKAQVEYPEAWFEVLTRNLDGQRTVHRLRAADQSAAVAEIESQLEPGLQVIGSAPAGHNLGSSDGINDLVDTT